MTITPETDDPAIGAILPYFGGKRTLAPAIVEEFGPHLVYWEPFCGSMAVLLEKEPCQPETVNDLHGDLVNLARVIQDPTEGPRFYRRLRRALVSEALFRDSAAVIDAPYHSEFLDAERAHHYFVVSWLGRNGIAGTTIGQKRGAAHSFCVRYTNNGGRPGKRWASAIQSIPQWRRRLREVTILNRDAFEVIGKIDDVDGTIIYVDSPYLPETRTGWNGSGGQSRYLHDFKPEDHARLATAMARFKHARVVVSYYDHPSLAMLYPGWTIRHLAGNKGIANAAKRDKTGETKAAEVILVNGPSFVVQERPAAMLF